MKNRFLTPLILLLAASAGTGVEARSILSIRDSMQRVPIIYPESFETDASAMQENWYLRNYADIDRQADSRTSVSVSDEEIIARLAAIPTTIELPFNSVVRNYIDMYANRRKQLVENMLGMSLYYMPIFEQALDRYGLPLELKYLPVIESAINPDAVSRVGATGLWQFMMATATGEGLEVTTLVDQRRDPYASTDAAARYLKKLYDIYGDWSLAIASYNCGPGNVNKAIRRAGLPTDAKKDFWAVYPFLPAETRGYVPAFIAAVYIMNYYDKHNISPALARKPILTDTIHVSRRVHFRQISDVMGMPVEELRVLNPQYRQDLIPGDIHPYSLVLPSLQVYAYLANEDSIVNHDADKYARRDIVEPATGAQGTDSKGEYVEELVVKYHTVKRGETLASIAKKYGVTQASVRQANGNIRKVRRGQRLKINTYRRKYIETPAPVQTTTPAATTPVLTDSIAAAGADSITVTPPDTTVTENARQVQQAMSRSAEAKTQTSQPAKPVQAASRNASASRSNNTSAASTRSHTVKSGENLSKIAKKYGVTVEAIRSANNISGDNIRAGQKLKIPAAGASSSSKSSSRKRSRRR